ncbi:hypothetical protein Aduo_001925 [Ancylostoma duodenale]
MEAIVRGQRNGITTRHLAEQFNVGQFTIVGVLKRYHQYGRVLTLKSSGRRKCTTRLLDRNILRLCRENPRLSATDIAKEISVGLAKVPSIRTIRRRLKAGGLYARRPARKPFISLKNRRARLDWARAHLHWTKAEWQRVIWSDESKFLLFGTDGIAYIRRPTDSRYDPKYQIPTRKHGGGNVLVWGCISSVGMGPLHRIQGIMTGKVYEDILENVMLPWARQHHGRAFVFQQDNDPEHSSQMMKEWFRRKRVDVMEWPSQSPDLNIIEHVWRELGKRVSHQLASNSDQKFALLKKA